MDADAAHFEGMKDFLSPGYFYMLSTARETESQSGILSCPGQREHLWQDKEYLILHLNLCSIKSYI